MSVCPCSRVANSCVCPCSSVANSHNFKARAKGMFFGFLGFLLPLILLVNFLASNASRDILVSMLGRDGTHTLYHYLVGESNPNLLITGLSMVCCNCNPSRRPVDVSGVGRGSLVHTYATYVQVSRVFRKRETNSYF